MVLQQAFGHPLEPLLRRSDRDLPRLRQHGDAPWPSGVPAAWALLAKLQIALGVQPPEGGVDSTERHVTGGALGWESVVTVNQDQEQVRIFMKMNDGQVQGITVMAVEATEAVFVNVIGNLNPAELEKVMDNFDVDIDP